MENFIGKRVKILRTDNGGEFTSKAFEAHLKACGIRHELTIPKTPEQNGVAERLNRTLVETTRAMLSDANLPQKFWAEAVSTAACLLEEQKSELSSGRNHTPPGLVRAETSCGSPESVWMHSVCPCPEG